VAAKKDKLTELPKLDEWKAPWEIDADGKDLPEDDQEIDAARLKKYLHGLLGDKLKLQVQVDETTARAEELEQKVADAVDPAKLTELQQEVTKARQERDEAKNNAKDNAEVLRYRVALRKGLTEVQAKRLLGSTEEELEQDAEELLASFGGKGTVAAGDEDDEVPVRKGPRRTVVNPGDTGSRSGSDKDDEIDPDEWAKGYAARHR
jgi:hypothetical protein